MGGLTSTPAQRSGDGHEDLASVGQRAAADEMLGRPAHRSPRGQSHSAQSRSGVSTALTAGLARCCREVVRCEMPTVANDSPAQKARQSSARISSLSLLAIRWQAAFRCVSTNVVVRQAAASHFVGGQHFRCHSTAGAAKFDRKSPGKQSGLGQQP